MAGQGAVTVPPKRERARSHDSGHADLFGGLFVEEDADVYANHRKAKELTLNEIAVVNISLDQAIDIKDYLTEARLRKKSPLAGKTVADLKVIGGGGIEIVSILRNERRVQAPLPDASLQAGDIILLRGDAAVLERVVAEGGLDLAGKDRPTQKQDALDPDRIAEAIIGPDSTLIGQSAGDIALHSRFGVNMIAISRSGERFSQRLRDIRLRAGDIVVIQGDEKLLPEKLSELGLLPLADRLVPLGSTRRVVLTVTIVLAAIIALAAGLAPVPLVFFAAAVLLIAFRCVPLREAYQSIDAPILLMLAALIPVSDSLRTTGATDLFASWLAMIGGGLPVWASVALILVAAMAVTPFLNNAATVLVMAPIGAGFAKNLGYNPDAFLMAVAIGAACDFLTPIGHQCNTLVMGPGGYRFSDYARLGAPLSLLVRVPPAFVGLSPSGQQWARIRQLVGRDRVAAFEVVLELGLHRVDALVVGPLADILVTAPDQCQGLVSPGLLGRDGKTGNGFQRFRGGVLGRAAAGCGDRQCGADPDDQDDEGQATGDQAQIDPPFGPFG